MTPRVPKNKFPALARLLGLAAVCLLAPPAFADCEKERNSYAERIKQYEKELGEIGDDNSAKANSAKSQLEHYRDKQKLEVRACEEKIREDLNKKDRQVRDFDECKKQIAATKGVYKWDPVKFRCIDLSESKSLPDTDECNSASIFTNLKGQNCKKAMNVVKNVQTRNSAITDATTAATTAYSGMQATGATGAQNDAQIRQANIMKTLAMSKFATGALNLQGAMQLKSAAAGAEEANSTITGAQKNLAAKCEGSTDDQICFYQNAKDFGISADAQSYANFDRMKRGATQSQEQADAANALAKTSMLTGAADMLVAMQAYKATQMANQNSAAMAPPPFIAPPPPPGSVRFGDASRTTSEPNLAPGTAAPPTDYGNPSDEGLTFGDQKSGRMGGAMVGRMGTPTGYKPASSSVSGGGGGSASAGGGSLRSGGGGASGKRGGLKSNTGVGEYVMGGTGTGFKGGGSAEKGDGSNPMADMLAKLFPQDQNGKPVVDTRQIASGGEALGVESEMGDNPVTASDLSLFEQVSAKYRQLNGTGRF